MKSIFIQAIEDKSQLIGSRVTYIGDSDDIIKNRHVYTVIDVLLANDCCFLKLRELPERVCRPFTSRQEVPGNIYDSKYFIRTL